MGDGGEVQSVLRGRVSFNGVRAGSHGFGGGSCRKEQGMQSVVWKAFQACSTADHVCKLGQIFLFGLSAGFIPQFFKDQLAQVLPYCDYVFANENEIKTWTETQGHPTKSIPEMAKLLALTPKKNTKRPRVVIVTQGTDPTVIATANNSGDAEIKEVPVLAIDSSKIVDTNGAG